MTSLARPPVVGQAFEETGDLLPLADDHGHPRVSRLAPAEILRAEGGLVVVGEDRRRLAEEPPDPEPVDHERGVPEVDQGLPDRPLAALRRPVVEAGPHGGDGLPERGGCGADLIDDGTMFGAHGSPPWDPG